MPSKLPRLKELKNAATVMNDDLSTQLEDNDGLIEVLIESMEPVEDRIFCQVGDTILKGQEKLLALRIMGIRARITEISSMDHLLSFMKENWISGYKSTMEEDLAKLPKAVRETCESGRFLINAVFNSENDLMDYGKLGYFGPFHKGAETCNGYGLRAKGELFTTFLECQNRFTSEKGNFKFDGPKPGGRETLELEYEWLKSQEEDWNRMIKILKANMNESPESALYQQEKNMDNATEGIKKISGLNLPNGSELTRKFEIFNEYGGYFGFTEDDSDKAKEKKIASPPEYPIFELSGRELIELGVAKPMAIDEILLKALPNLIMSQD